MTDFDMTGLFSAMDLVVLERLDNRSLRVIGQSPDWFEELYPVTDGEDGKVLLEEDSSFLAVFMEEAKDFWADNKPGQMTSDMWTETDSSGNEYALEASALCFGGKDILIVRSLGSSFTERQAVFQKVRETLLDKETLERIVAERTAELRTAKDDLEKALNEIVHVLALTVEVRDPYTSGHQKRVADLARAIAVEMRLPEGVTESVYIAGTIHDVGKISIPSELLTKPSRLNKDEFNLIKPHPQVGYDILKDIDFPWDIAQMVLQHHEKLDGSGYPHGLSGEDITLEARILTVADIVESMAAHRPYRPALGVKIALAEITKNRGVLYDPDVVDACVKLFSEKGYQGMEIKDTEAWLKRD